MNTLTRSLLIFLFSIFITACGGGGASTNEPFSHSPSQLTFSSQIDAVTAPADQIITLIAQEAQAEIPTLSISGTAIDVVSKNVVNTTTIEVSVRVKIPATLGIGTHTGSVSIASSQYSTSVPITYIITAIPPGNPTVDYISPYIITPNTLADVIIRGSGFSRFDSNSLPTVTIGSVAATNITIINDSEIRVTTPSLSAGTHSVVVQGGSVSFTSTASLKVITDQTFSTASFITSGEKSALIIDKERKAIYVVNTTTDSLDRYRFQSGTTWNMDSLSLSGLTDAALSTDGKTLVLIDGVNFYKVDPAATTMTTSTGVAAPLGTSQSLDRIATSNNGVMIAVNNNQWSYIYKYDLQTDLTSKHTYYNSSAIEVNTSLYKPWLFDTPDGSQIYLGEYGKSTSYLYQLNTSDDSVSDTGIPGTSFSGYYDMAMTPDKSVILVNGKDIYNANLSALQGTLSQVHNSSAISPDGNTVYVYLDFTNILRAFDISNPATPVQIGSDVNLTDQAGMRTQMRISSDGKNLFLVGLENLHIIDLTTFSF